jgi:hypothetical protein
MAFSSRKYPAMGPGLANNRAMTHFHEMIGIPLKLKPK